jgi:outer membrane lipoprotein SlyB
VIKILVGVAFAIVAITAGLVILVGCPNRDEHSGTVYPIYQPHPVSTGYQPVSPLRPGWRPSGRMPGGKRR